MAQTLGPRQRLWAELHLLSAHLLHLMLKDALGLGSAKDLNLDAVIHDLWHLLQNFWNFMSHFSCCVKATRLCKKQALVGMLKHHLLSDVSIFWNST